MSYQNVGIIASGAAVAIDLPTLVYQKAGSTSADTFAFNFGTTGGAAIDDVAVVCIMQENNTRQSPPFNWSERIDAAFVPAAISAGIYATTTRFTSAPGSVTFDIAGGGSYTIQIWRNCREPIAVDFISTYLDSTNTTDITKKPGWIWGYSGVSLLFDGSGTINPTITGAGVVASTADASPTSGYGAAVGYVNSDADVVFGINGQQQNTACMIFYNMHTEIAYVDHTSTSIGGASSNQVITLPTNNLYDFVYLFMSCDDSFDIAITESGWDTLADSNSNDVFYKMYRKKNPGPSVTVTSTNGSGRISIMARAYKNGGAYMETAGATSGTLDPDSPSITPKLPGCMAISWGIIDDDTTTSGLAAPSGYGNLAFASAGSSSGSNSIGLTSDKLTNTLSAVDPGVYTSSNDDAWVAFTILLYPAYVVPITTLTYVASATSVDEFITYPPETDDGYLAVLVQYSCGSIASPGYAEPAGFSNILNVPANNNRQIIGARVTTADLAGTTVTGMNGISYAYSDKKVMHLFKADQKITGFNVSGLNSAANTDADPASQVIPVSSANPLIPLIALGVFGTEQNAVSPRSWTPSADGEANSSDNSLYVGYKIFNYGATLSDITIDMDDEGNGNWLGSLCIEVNNYPV